MGGPLSLQLNSCFVSKIWFTNPAPCCEFCVSLRTQGDPIRIRHSHSPRSYRQYRRSQCSDGERSVLSEVNVKTDLVPPLPVTRSSDGKGPSIQLTQQRQNGSKDSLIEERSPLSTNNFDGKPATKIVKTVQVSRFKVETWLMNWRWRMDFGVGKWEFVYVCKRRNLTWWSFLQDAWKSSLLVGRPSNGFITNTILGVWLIEDKLPDRQPKPKVFAKRKDQQLHFQKNEQQQQQIAATKQALWSAL